MSEKLTEKTIWILIVEDEAELSDLLKLGLEKTGLKVLCAADMLSAATMVKNQKFSCIVADQMVGEKTGENFIKQIRSNSLNLNYATPILLMSGALNADLLKNLSGAISGAIVKPFEIAEFAKKVRVLCGL